MILFVEGAPCILCDDLVECDEHTTVLPLPMFECVELLCEPCAVAVNRSRRERGMPDLPSRGRPGVG